MSFRFLYYNNINIIWSPELVIKYIKRETDFKYNIKKVLGVIKAIILDNNKDCFKDKTDASQL